MKTMWKFCLMMVAGAAIQAVQGVAAQDFEYDYFPHALMQADDVKGVLIYETHIDDPLGQSGLNNQLRLAKQVGEEVFFDRIGNCERKLYYDDEEQIRDLVLYAYNKEYKCTSSEYHHRAPATLQSTDSNTVVVFEKKTMFGYKGDLVNMVLELDSKSKVQDSTKIEYDPQGRKLRSFRKTLAGSVESRYEYHDNQVVITCWSTSTLLSKTQIFLDDQGRAIQKAYFQGQDSLPTTREFLQYHPRGWLEDVRYEYSGAAASNFSALVSRQNTYDDHGKLMESSLDYGTGSRLLRLYDYSYYIDKE